MLLLVSAGFSNCSMICFLAARCRLGLIIILLEDLQLIVPPRTTQVCRRFDTRHFERTVLESAIWERGKRPQCLSVQGPLLRGGMATSGETEAQAD